jgi:hypothetical protein
MFLQLRVAEAGRAARDHDHALDRLIREEQRQQLAADQTCRAEKENAAARHLSSALHIAQFTRRVAVRFTPLKESTCSDDWQT